MGAFPDMIQVVLPEDSTDMLSSFVSGGRYPKKFMHHVTLAFKPDEEAYRSIVLADPENPLQDGEPVKIHLRHHVFDDDFGVEAVSVKVSRQDGSEVPSTNKHPHITISTNEDMKPVQSNDLLARTNHHKFDMIPASIDGVVRFVNYGRK